MPIEIPVSSLRIGPSFAQVTAKHVTQGQRRPRTAKTSIIRNNGASINLMSLVLLSATIALSYWSLMFLAAFNEPITQVQVSDRAPLQYNRFAFAPHAARWLEKFGSVDKPNYAGVKQIKVTLQSAASTKRINATTSVAYKSSETVDAPKAIELIAPNQKAEKVLEVASIKSFEPPSRLGRRTSKRSVRRIPKPQKISEKPQRDWRMLVLFPDSSSR
jgi:hypothetical protein